MQLACRSRLPCSAQPCAGLASYQRLQLSASRLRAATCTAQRHLALRVKAQATPGGSAPGGGDQEEERPGFIANLLKPLRDFGIGRTSMMQGGVGLFVFAGIGAPGAPPSCICLRLSSPAPTPLPVQPVVLLAEQAPT